MARRRLMEVLFLAVAVAITVALLWRAPRSADLEGPVMTPSPSRAPYRDLAGYSILGVRPGMNVKQVEALLGAGRLLAVKDGVKTTRYGRYDTREDPGRQDRWAVAVWSSKGRVATVKGSHLHRNGHEVLGRGWPADSLRTALGPFPAEVGKLLLLLPTATPPRWGSSRWPR